MLRRVFILCIVILIFSNTLIYSDNLFLGLDNYGTEIHLTSEERKYLNDIGSITMCVDPNWMPYESIDNRGKYIGILSDYIKLFSKRLNIKFKLVNTSNYPESRSYLDSNKCIIIAADVATEEVKEKYFATRPYYFAPRVFALNKSHKMVKNFEEILEETIGVQQESPAAFLLKKQYPNIKIKTFIDTDTGLKELENNEIDAFVTIIGSISYSIQKQNLRSIKIGGEVLNEVPLSILINKNYPKLVPILNKVIATITFRDSVNILENWVVIRNEGFIDYTLIFQIVLVALAIILFMLYHTISVRRLNKLLKKKNQELSDISMTDSLTGIMNRRAITTIIESDVSKNIRSGLTSCLLLFDIDHFKNINDKYGHDMGDEALRKISLSIKSIIRKIDFFARWGGEEFLILASGTSLYNASHLGEKIRKYIENLEFKNGMKTTVSIGIAEFTNNENIEEWYKRVDEALYLAKNSGRNTIKLDNMLNEANLSRKNPFSQVTWKMEYTSGNLKIDNEHRDLFNRVSLLSDRILNDNGSENLLAELESLISDTKLHFINEEEIFRNTKYTKSEEHITEHVKLISRADSLIKLYKEGTINKTEILSYFIFDLIAMHVLKYDLEYFKYV